jgi:tetratricopeptide (TPR) repeat protein
MADLSQSKAIVSPSRVGVASERVEFEKLMQLGNGQLECDNRQEALSYYRQAKVLAEAVAAPAEIIFLCRRLGEAYQLRAEYEDARAALAEAERWLERYPDDLELGQVLALRGSIATDVGRFSQAQRLLKRAYELLKPSGDHQALGAVERRLGKLYLRWGPPQEARNYFESALATFRRIGDQRGIAGTLNNLGVLHKLACEWIEAIRVMEKGLVLNEILADEAQIGALCINLGVVHLKLGQWMRAEERLERAVTSMARIANRRGLANAYIARANLAIRLRHWDQAETWLNQALELARTHGIVRAEGLARESLGDLAFERGQFDQAESELLSGLELARGLGATNELVGELGRRLGEVYVSTGRLDEALVLAEEAIHIARKVGDLFEEALCHRLLARVHGMRGEQALFQHHAAQVIDRLSHMGERWEQMHTFLALGDVWMRMGAAFAPRWMEEAQTAYQRAETLALGLELPVEGARAALKLAALDFPSGRLDQALVRIGAALRQTGDREVELRQELIDLRGDVENSIASGYGPTAAEREAFQEVTRLYGNRAEVSAVLDNLLGLVIQRSGSDHAFFAWDKNQGRNGIAVRSAGGFRRGEATRILNGLGRQVVEEILAGGRPLIATEPQNDPRLAGVEARDPAPLSVAILPFQIEGQVRGMVYVERAPGNDAGPYRSAEIALLAMLTNVVAIAAVESERARIQTEGVPAGEPHPAWRRW